MYLVAIWCVFEENLDFGKSKERIGEDDAEDQSEKGDQ